MDTNTKVNVAEFRGPSCAIPGQIVDEPNRESEQSIVYAFGLRRLMSSTLGKGFTLGGELHVG